MTSLIGQTGVLKVKLCWNHKLVQPTFSLEHHKANTRQISHLLLSTELEISTQNLPSKGSDHVAKALQ